MSQIMKRNAHTAEGSQQLWEYAFENFFQKNIDAGNHQRRQEKRLKHECRNLCFYRYKISQIK